MSSVRERVREQPLPGEAEAAARVWPVVEAALAERAPRRQRRAPLRLALVAALLGIGLVAALSPAGAEVGDWIGDRIERDAPRTPAFASLPEGGSVLAITRTGAYAVRPDGNTQHLGSFTDAAWSPRGLHVVGVDGSRVVAVDPLGTTKWTIARPSRVHRPAWSLGEGFAVAYLQGQRPAGRGRATAIRRRTGVCEEAPPRSRLHGVRAATACWRSRPEAAAVEAIDVETGRTLWRASVRPRPRARLEPERTAPRRALVRGRHRPACRRSPPVHTSAAGRGP